MYFQTHLFCFLNYQNIYGMPTGLRIIGVTEQKHRPSRWIRRRLMSSQGAIGRVVVVESIR